MLLARHKKWTAQHFSLHHPPESDPEPLGLILHATSLVVSITWEVETKVKEAIQGAEIPPQTPPKRLYVLKELGV